MGCRFAECFHAGEPAYVEIDGKTIQNVYKLNFPCIRVIILHFYCIQRRKTQSPPTAFKFKNSYSHRAEIRLQSEGFNIVYLKWFRAEFATLPSTTDLCCKTDSEEINYVVIGQNCIPLQANRGESARSPLVDRPIKLEYKCHILSFNSSWILISFCDAELIAYNGSACDEFDCIQTLTSVQK
jgi:hypothetical protein